MKIVKLNAANIKKLVAVEITPKGDIVTISGRNAQGKSSILDSIMYALAGTKDIPSQPIRKGQTKAHVRLDLGEFIVERRFTENGSTVTIENAAGARYPSPQKMLDAMLGRLSFDPLDFATMEPRAQFDELRKIAKIEIDVDQLDGLNRSDYERRADINRQAKLKRAQVEGMPIPEGLPEGPINEDEFLNRIQEAGERNAMIERHKASRATAQAEANENKARAIKLRERSSKLREEAALQDEEATKLLDEAAATERAIDNASPPPDPVDASVVRAELESARLINGKIVFRDKRRQVEQEAELLEQQAAEITETMGARAQAKADAIAKAQMPVDGLGLGEGIVTYRGVPFDQASSAEQLRVSLSIAMAANPKVRVIRIQDGSLLDADSLAQIAEMAKAGDYQIWIEKVSDDGKVGIVIEDGAVKSTPETRAAAA